MNFSNSFMPQAPGVKIHPLENSGMDIAVLPGEAFSILETIFLNKKTNKGENYGMAEKRGVDGCFAVSFAGKCCICPAEP